MQSTANTISESVLGVPNTPPKLRFFNGCTLPYTCSHYWTAVFQYLFLRWGIHCCFSYFQNNTKSMTLCNINIKRNVFRCPKRTACSVSVSSFSEPMSKCIHFNSQMFGEGVQVSLRLERNVSWASRLHLRHYTAFQSAWSVSFRIPRGLTWIACS